MWQIIGWFTWLFDVYLALTFAYGCRKSAVAGVGFQWATAVQTFFWWIIAIIFLITSWNKLHIIWIMPVGFISASFITLGNIPIISHIVLVVTRLFMSVILFGVKKT
jgi:hypothetical protein